jgi:hypothetical protein
LLINAKDLFVGAIHAPSTGSVTATTIKSQSSSSLELPSFMPAHERRDRLLWLRSVQVHINLREENMEPHILFAIVLLVTAQFDTVGHGTWTAEFTSKQNCEAAALALKQMVGTPGASGQGFVQFTCVKK